MRIVHLTRKTGDIRASRLAYALDKLGHSNVLVMGLEYQPSTTTIVPRPNWPTPDSKIEECRLAAQATLEQRSDAIKAMKPDLIVMHEALTFQMVGALPDVPLILDHHEFDLGMSYQFDSPRIKDRRDAVLRKLMSDSRIVAHMIPSEDLVIELRRDMRHNFDRWDLPIFPVHNGIPLLPEDYRPRTEEARAWLCTDKLLSGEPKEPLADPEDKFVVFCGNLTSDRRPDLLIQTVGELQRRDTRWRALVLSGAEYVDRHIGEQLLALDTLFLEPVRYPWPWKLEDITTLDVCSLGALGFSFAEISHPSWRGAAPNKASDYSASGLYQVCDPCTWLSSSLGTSGEAIADDPVKIADMAEMIDFGQRVHSYGAVSYFADRYAIDGTQDLPQIVAAMECV